MLRTTSGLAIFFFFIFNYSILKNIFVFQDKLSSGNFGNLGSIEQKNPSVQGIPKLKAEQKRTIYEKLIDKLRLGETYLVADRRNDKMAVGSKYRYQK